MTSKELAKVAVAALEDKKGGNVKVLDISNLTVIADYFIIVDGSNRNHIQALADNVQEELYKQCHVDAKSVEGYQSESWILLDYNDIIIHIFNTEDRLFYDIERIWRDGKVVEASEL